MYLVKESKKFRKYIRRYLHSGGIKREDIETIVKILAMGEKLEPRHKDHELKGKLQGVRECHIESDLLLLYQIDEENKTLFPINIALSRLVSLKLVERIGLGRSTRYRKV